MIDVVRVKRAIGVAAGLLVVLVTLVAVRNAADAVLRSATGADPTSVFNDIPTAPVALADAVEWMVDPARDGRQMEPTTRESITDAYTRALAALDRAGRGDAASPLADYLSGPALDAALEAVNVGSDRTTATFHLRHELRLDQYSDDGSIVAVSVPTVDVVRVVDGRLGRTISSSHEQWRFVMLLEDGNWRVRQLQTVSVTPQLHDGLVRPFVDAVRGVNIVTSSGPDATWRGFDAVTAAADLDAAVELGYDTVRVFVAGPEFGAVDVGALERFLDLAGERDLNVMPVLFDGSDRHHPAGWADDRGYLDDVVGAIVGHPAVVAWDLKNEPDLDDERSGGAAIVDAWLAQVGARVRTLDALTPITVGWSNAGDAVRGLDLVDLVSFHHFGSADDLVHGLERLRSAAGNRPVVVSEFGVPAYVGPVRGSMPTSQARAVVDLIEVLDREGREGSVAGSMLWLLRDPAEPVEEGLIAGRASTSYGVLRHDRTERPLADVVRFGRAGLRSPTLVERGRGAVPLLLLTLAGSAAVVGVWRARRRSQWRAVGLTEP